MKPAAGIESSPVRNQREPARRILWPGGPSVCPIGLGTWGLGGSSYGPIDEAEAAKVVSHAVACGINFIDTSDLYGNGRAEAIVGEVSRRQRDRVVIATKGGMLPHTGLKERQDFTPTYLEHALTRSLGRLQTDYIDLYLLHSPPLRELQDHHEVLRFLDRERARGRARAVGISAKSPKDAVLAVGLYEFDVVEVNFNLIDQRAIDDGLFDGIEQTGRQVIARTPLCFGFLTGDVTADTAFAPGDHRANWPRDQLLRWSSAPTLFEPVAAARGESIAALALDFCLAPTAVACAIPGMLSAREIEENLQALQRPPLTPAEMAQIRMVYRSGDFFNPSARRRGKQQ